VVIVALEVDELCVDEGVLEADEGLPVLEKTKGRRCSVYG
jgi:hypothetical protein